MKKKILSLFSATAVVLSVILFSAMASVAADTGIEQPEDKYITTCNQIKKTTDSQIEKGCKSPCDSPFEKALKAAGRSAHTRHTR